MINEREFIQRLILKSDQKLSDEKAKRLFDLFIETLTECLAEGHDVRFRGFGKFEIRETKARSSVNLNNKEISIRSHKRVHFKQGKPLKALIDTPKLGGDE